MQAEINSERSEHQPAPAEAPTLASLPLNNASSTREECNRQSARTQRIKSTMLFRTALQKKWGLDDDEFCGRFGEKRKSSQKFCQDLADFGELVDNKHTGLAMLQEAVEKKMNKGKGTFKELEISNTDVRSCTEEWKRMTEVDRAEKIERLGKVELWSYPRADTHLVPPPSTDPPPSEKHPAQATPATLTTKRPKKHHVPTLNSAALNTVAISTSALPSTPQMDFASSLDLPSALMDSPADNLAHTDGLVSGVSSTNFSDMDVPISQGEDITGLNDTRYVFELAEENGERLIQCPFDMQAEPANVTEGSQAEGTEASLMQEDGPIARVSLNLPVPTKVVDDNSEDKPYQGLWERPVKEAGEGSDAQGRPQESIRDVTAIDRGVKNTVSKLPSHKSVRPRDAIRECTPTQRATRKRRANRDLVVGTMPGIISTTDTVQCSNTVILTSPKSNEELNAQSPGVSSRSTSQRAPDDPPALDAATLRAIELLLDPTEQLPTSAFDVIRHFAHTDTAYVDPGALSRSHLSHSPRLTECGMIIAPLYHAVGQNNNGGGHWTLAVVRGDTISHYDSLAGCAGEEPLLMLRELLREATGRDFTVVEETTPQQADTVSCGLHVIMHGVKAATGASPPPTCLNALILRRLCAALLSRNSARYNSRVPAGATSARQTEFFRSIRNAAVTAEWAVGAVVRVIGGVEAELECAQEELGMREAELQRLELLNEDVERLKSVRDGAGDARPTICACAALSKAKLADAGARVARAGVRVGRLRGRLEGLLAWKEVASGFVTAWQRDRVRVMELRRGMQLQQGLLEDKLRKAKVLFGRVPELEEMLAAVVKRLEREIDVLKSEVDIQRELLVQAA